MTLSAPSTSRSPEASSKARAYSESPSRPSSTKFKCKFIKKIMERDNKT